MKTRDSFGREGVIVAQDWREPKSGETGGGVASIEFRNGEYALRITGRDPYGTYEVEKHLRGDVLGLFAWQQIGADRPIPAWQHVRGSVVMGDPGGPTTGGAPQLVAPIGGSLGMVGLPTTPISAPPRPTNVQPQSGPTLKADPRFIPWSFPWQGTTTGPGSTPGATGTRIDGVEGTLPPSWPAFPIGTTGLMVQTTDERKQIMAWHPTDPRLVAPNRAGSPAHGTVVSDLTSRGGYDETVTAPLQSIFNVVLRPRDAFGLKTNTANVVGFQIGRSGLLDSPGTVFVDGDGGRVKVLGRPSVRDGGPLDCVRGGCKHTTGADGDGNPITPVHLSDVTLFRTGLRAPTTVGTANSVNLINGQLPPGVSVPGATYTTSPGGQFDGPIDFEVRWPTPNIEGPYPVQCHIGYDPEKDYRISRDGKEIRHVGMWRIWTGVYIGTNDAPPVITPREPRDPPPPPPPPGPITPRGGGVGPTTPGGGTPSDGGDEGGPGSPGGDGGKGPTSPSGGGSGPESGGGSPGGGGGGGSPPAPPPSVPGGDNHGGPTTPTSDGETDPPTPNDDAERLREYERQRQQVQDSLLEQLRLRRTADKALTSTIAANSSALMVARVQGTTPLETVMPSIVARPQIMALGAFDLRVQPQSPPGAVARMENENPQVLRSESFGKQDGATFVHTQRPGTSRSLSGTGSGGTMDLVPEHDMTDVAFNSAYGDTTSMTGASSASRIIGYGVTLAFGKPSLSTGKPTESVGATADHTNKSVQFAYYDAGGTPTDIVEIKSNALVLADQVDIQTNTGTGTIIATTSSQKIGFFGTAATTQPAAVADASGGAVIDDQARAAINSLLARLRTLGLIDT